MGKVRPDRKAQSAKVAKQKAQQKSTENTAQRLLEETVNLLHHGQAEGALPLAHEASELLSRSSKPVDELPALALLGEIHLELGDPDAARECFLKASTLDPDGLIDEEAGGGATKFLWLAQLCEEGGEESVTWFEKGCQVLRRDISKLEDMPQGREERAEFDEKQQKLSNALCGLAEIYMTDLSWDNEAETRCEALVTEACTVRPDIPEPLQTLASVRISQNRIEDARSALLRSIETWSDLPETHPLVPDFSLRISLTRLLMEVEMEGKAVDVLDRLINEDDSSVEAWYLGGWCHRLLAQKSGNQGETPSDHVPNGPSSHGKYLSTSRDWLQNCLKLYALQEYEDERLYEHAKELVAELNQTLGPPDESNAGGEDDEAVWEDEDEDDEDGDEEMQESEYG
ncbi:MAG: hypothetical protein M1831_005766 [Alyxoria varia]|nr:MAG: hypothetical protein M1831_005766 [Alyxoria varia]